MELARKARDREPAGGLDLVATARPEAADRAGVSAADRAEPKRTLRPSRAASRKKMASKDWPLNP